MFRAQGGAYIRSHNGQPELPTRRRSPPFMRLPHQDELLERHLRTYLGDIEEAALDELRACLEWMTVPAGVTMMHEGEAGDAMYLVLTGRLRAYVKDDDGRPNAVR